MQKPASAPFCDYDKRIDDFELTRRNSLTRSCVPASPLLVRTIIITIVIVTAMIITTSTTIIIVVVNIIVIIIAILIVRVV